MTTETVEITVQIDHYFCGTLSERALCGKEFKDSDPVISPETPLGKDNILCTVCNYMDGLEMEHLGGRCLMCGEFCDDE